MERFTRQRTAILAAIAGADRPLSPREVLDLARTSVEGLGLATVYRNLRALLDEGLIEAVHLPGDSARYEPASRGHHHHFHCTACTRVFDVHDCPGDLRNLAPQGFVVESHALTLYGRCADCAGGRRVAARASEARPA